MLPAKFALSILESLALALPTPALAKVSPAFVEERSFAVKLPSDTSKPFKFEILLPAKFPLSILESLALALPHPH